MTETYPHGIHHVTAIAGDAQQNLDFYTRTLGLRLVKRSVNQDAPDTYHLFYADAVGHPGTDLTFFPWPQLPPVHQGVGLAVEVAFAVPSGTLDFWREQLDRQGRETRKTEERFGEQAVTLKDPHGLELALVETAASREFAPWSDSPVPEAQQIRGLHAVRLWERDPGFTARFLTDVLGMRAVGEEDGWQRFIAGENASGGIVDVKAVHDAGRGQWGTGGVHHVAWRVEDEDALMAARDQVRAVGGHPTDVIDRFWFKSVYFREPGGVLFELATDGPGFAIDEDATALGEQLILPPWLEPQRRQIEAALPRLVAR